ncbi:hypothetical protein QO200_18690 [Flavobacterium sp. Arc3]|uniref:helix-turn-helix transcriptional regulator n=1 Tax=Flavobacterium sp. Arc3 TaxID=3046686 RepID=UPI00352C199D
MNEQRLQLIQISVTDLRDLISDCIAAELQKVMNFTSQAPKPETEILTREQTKDLLGISYVTLWKYNRDGTLQARKVKGKVFYLRQDINNLLNNVA